MRVLIKIFVVIFLFIIPVLYTAMAEDERASNVILFQGLINANDINIRADSTTSSGIICKINKGEIVEVTQELYDWHKIRLPKNAPSFVKKDMVSSTGENTAKVIKDNVNIRFGPDESSWILGKVSKNELVNILGDKGVWYKIEPVNNSFGWIYKKFVDRVTASRNKNIPSLK